MFTPFFLQDALVKELGEIFKTDRYPDNRGDLVPLRIYKQFLPIEDAGRGAGTQEELESSLLDDAIDRLDFPYIVVILTDGMSNTVGKTGRVEVLLHIGVRDDGKNRDGYQWIINVIQKICERFQKNRMVDGYQCGEEIVWEMSLLDDHPAYFGAVGMEFATTTIRRESAYC